MSDQENPPTPISKSLMQRYADSPLAQTLLTRSIPIFGTYIDKAISQEQSEMLEERLQTYIDECSVALIGALPDLAKDKDFVHCHMETLERIKRTHSKEKIKRFARLLGSCANKESRGNVDRYEELLSILDELSEREFNILAAIYNAKGGERISALNKIEIDQSKLRNSKDKCLLAVLNLGIDISELRSILTRLSRTGLIIAETGGPLIGAKPVENWKLTPTFHELARRIKATPG